MRAFIIIISLTLSNFLLTSQNVRQLAIKDNNAVCCNCIDNKNIANPLMASLPLIPNNDVENLIISSNSLDFYNLTSKSANSQDTVYHFKVRLTKALPRTPDCGYMAFALVQKFEVISTDFPNFKDKFILLIQPCPEFLGKDFFKTDNVYNVDAAKTSGETIAFTYTNTYDKERLPIFWSRKIIKTN